MFRVLFLAALLIAAPAIAAAQTTKPVPASAKKPPATKTAPQRGKTTLAGVYTREEADAGKEMYAGLCASCHTAASHTGAMFKQKWAGRPLSDLYTYIRTQMPKNDPASLADEDYAVLLAYMLQMNKMPAGKAYLSTDTVELAKIRIDTAVAVRKK